VETQIRTSFDNISSLLIAAGGSLTHVVKLTAYFTDMAALDTYTRILGEVFPTSRPAQTVLQVARLAMPELLVELDATAVL
jgi:2-iminobutanoate/2-iminopropanoate deaminase